VKERITSIDHKDPNYVCLHHICYADDSIIVWISILGKTYKKNVTSFLKENLFRSNIKKKNLTYIISNRIDIFPRSENIYDKSPKCAYN
jgi:hypothetical protein